MNYILDTDIISYIIKGRGGVIGQIAAYNFQSLAITSITVAEVLYGLEISPKYNKLYPFVKDLLNSFLHLDFNKKSAEIFAKIKSNLKKKGNLLADADLMISSICLENNCSLITNNIKHFSRIKALSLKPINFG